MLWWTLRQLKSNDAETRKYAAKKLGESKNIKAVEPLIFALKDPDGDVRGEVVEALGKIGEVAIDSLVATLQDVNNNDLVAKVLEALKYKPTNETEQAMMFVAKLEWDNAIKLGKGAVEVLISTLKDSNYYEKRKNAVKALAKIGDQRAVEPLITVLKDSYYQVRIEAAKAL